MLFMKMDLLNYQYLDKMNNNIGILCQYEGNLDSCCSVGFFFFVRGRFFALAVIALRLCKVEKVCKCGVLRCFFLLRKIRRKKMQARSFVVWDVDFFPLPCACALCK